MTKGTRYVFTFLVVSLFVWAVGRWAWVQWDNYVFEKKCVEHNKVRQALGIPIIEAGWENSYTSKNWMLWQASAKKDGFDRGKEINFKEREIVLERDSYFKKLGDTTYVLRLTYQYEDSTWTRELQTFINNSIVAEQLVDNIQADSFIRAGAW